MQTTNFLLLRQRKFQILFSITLCLFYYVIFAIISPSDLNNGAFFTGDVPDYQSQAVNLVKGHGFPIQGAVESFNTYDFVTVSEWIIGTNAQRNAKFKEEFIASSQYSFYRTPGYPLFLAAVYKIFGIHTSIAKHIQLMLLCLVSATLCWVGYYLWQIKGFFSGLIAGFLSLLTTYHYANTILTEVLIIFSLYSIIILWLCFAKYKNIVTATLLGISFGIMLLIKGSMIFIPLFAGIYFLYTAVAKKELKTLVHLALITISTLLIVLPWSIYASHKSGQTIFLSTQGSIILTEGHNEYVAKDGCWHPEWREIPDSFYNKLIKDKNYDDNKDAFKMVIEFYKAYPYALPHLSIKKIYAAFFCFPFLIISFILIAAQGMLGIFKKYLPTKLYFILLLTSTMISSGAVYMSFLLRESHNLHRLNHLADSNPEIQLAVVILAFCLVVFLLASKTRLIQVPSVFNIIFLNFVAISILFFAVDIGHSRFVKVIEFLFYLVGTYTIIEYISFLLEELKEYKIDAN